MSPSTSVAIALLTPFLAFSQAPAITIHATRVSDRPILQVDLPWAATGAFNPSAARVGNKTVLLFRATDKNKTSRIGYAESVNGGAFKVNPDPVLAPEAPYEKNGGVEDPRVVRIGDLYYLTYTGYNLHDAQLCLAVSRDLQHWDRKGVILPAYHGAWNTQWTKSGAIVPEKIDGKWWMYYLGTSKGPDGVTRDKMGLAVSKDLLHWTDATDKPVLDVRPDAFDSRVMEPGPAPFVTDAGILLLYNGADAKLVYRPAWVLFDRHDPRRVIARAEKPFLAPTLDWERVGVVPNVIFLEGAVERAARTAHSLHLTGYYGGADKYIGAANIDIEINSR